MQRDGKAGVHRSNNIVRGCVRSIVTRESCPNWPHSGNLYFGRVVLSRACAKRVILTTLHCDPHSLRRQDKWSGQYRSSCCTCNMVRIIREKKAVLRFECHQGLIPPIKLGSSKPWNKTEGRQWRNSQVNNFNRILRVDFYVPLIDPEHLTEIHSSYLTHPMSGRDRKTGSLLRSKSFGTCHLWNSFIWLFRILIILGPYFYIITYYII
jgi:hypothetical protein